MRVSSRLQAAKLAQAIDLDGVTSLVDLGCGSGDYSIALSQAHPGLKIISCDYPAVIDLVRKHVSEADLLDRITPTALDVLHDPLPKADAILLSHVLDGYGKEQVSSLLKRVYDALEPGGRLFLHAHIPSLSSGLFPYMFGLILLANTEEGEVRDTDDLRTLLREAGFRELQTSKVSALSGLLSAIK
jgi:cyclopropane fatty-acyl-phospholipid synthase-like methyltransferase